MEVETVQPISKHQALKSKQIPIPPEVIEAFNELIIENINSSGIAIVKRDDVVALAITKLSIESNQFADNWLDIEPIFENIGWNVRYNIRIAGYEAHFKFS